MPGSASDRLDTWRAGAGDRGHLVRPLLDLDGVAEPTPLDGVHFEADAHHAIGLAVAEALRGLFPAA